MPGGRPAGRAGAVIAGLLAAGTPALLASQVAANRAVLYLHPTDVADARAVWVNPAGLAVLRQASIHLDLTVRDPGEQGRLRQVTAGFSSRGLGFSYQRDAFDAGVTGHTYRLGFAGAEGGFAAGFAAALYRGDASATGWDVGLVYALHQAVTIGGAVSNLGEPDVRGARLPVTFVPGATVAPLGPPLALSGHALITRDSVSGYAFGARVSLEWPAPVAALVRLDTDRSLRRAAFAFGISVGTQDILGAVLTAPGDLGTPDAVSVHGLVIRPLAR
ncbi:MAG: hypothetical protein ACREMJ_02070 [Gemmatimonadales bacterium]